MKKTARLIALLFLTFVYIDVSALPVTDAGKGVRIVDGHISAPKDVNVRNEIEYQLFVSAQKKFLADDIRGAKLDYLKSVDENPAFFPSYIGLAEIEDKNGDQNKADDFFLQAFSAVKNSALLHTAYGKYLFKHQNISGAKNEFEKALNINPKQADANVELAVIYLSYLNKPQQSIKHYQAAVDTAPNNVAYLYGLSSAQAALGDVDKAISVLEVIARKLPGNALPWQYMGVHYARAGRFNESISAFKKSIKKNPKQMDSRWFLAEAFFMSEQYENALKEYQWLVDHNIKKDIAFLKQGVIFQVMQNFKKSKSSYLNAIKHNPNLPDVYNNLAYLMLETKSDYKKGLKWIQKAIHLQSDNPVFLDTQGWLYYQEGDYKSAQISLNKALEHNPEFAEVYYHLAKVSEKLNKKSDAIKYFAKLKKIDKNFQRD